MISILNRFQKSPGNPLLYWPSNPRSFSYIHTLNNIHTMLPSPLEKCPPPEGNVDLSFSPYLSRINLSRTYYFLNLWLKTHISVLATGTLCSRLMSTRFDNLNCALKENIGCNNLDAILKYSIAFLIGCSCQILFAAANFLLCSMAYPQCQYRILIRN